MAEHVSPESLTFSGTQRTVEFAWRWDVDGHRPSRVRRFGLALLESSPLAAVASVLRIGVARWPVRQAVAGIHRSSSVGSATADST